MMVFLEIGNPAGFLTLPGSQKDPSGCNIGDGPGKESSEEDTE